MMLNCAIIDDEPLAAGLLKSYAEKTPFLNLIGTYGSAVEAMKELREKPAQLLFLDIQMPELSGIEFAKILPAETKIIFTTAFQQYAIEGYKVSALDYLLKPISYDDFLRASNKALEWFSINMRQQACAHDRFMSRVNTSSSVSPSTTSCSSKDSRTMYVSTLLTVSASCRS